MIKNYPGAKTGTGIPQWLINNIPFHERYFELYLGSGALFQAKRPALHNILNDANKKVVHTWSQNAATLPASTYLFNQEAVPFIECTYSWSRRDFVYLDPPYPFSSRRTGQKYYKHEMEDSDHVQLLSTILAMDANVMISTRQNELYDQVLHEWRKDSFNTVDHGGQPAVEIIYMNYPPPLLLHQYDYLGNGYIDRQRIKRKIASFSAKIAALPPYEKHLFIQSLVENDAAAVQHFLTTGKHRQK